MANSTKDKIKALEFAKNEAILCKDGFYDGVTADDVATNVWDTLLEQKVDQGVACEAVEVFYATLDGLK